MIWEYTVQEWYPFYSYWSADYAEKRDVLLNRLNELGADGWELVGIIPSMEEGDTTMVTLFLKRRRGG
jgi:hypothetical protein